MTPQTLKVLTINIWNRQHPWEERLAMLRHGIAALAPDVVGMQEVLSDGQHDLAHEIADGLGYQVAFGVAKALPADHAFGNAVLSRFPIRDTQVFALPHADSTESRSVLYTLLETPGGQLPFLTTHLAWKFHHGFVREKQVVEVARILKTQVPLGDDLLPAVLTGDFNAAPDATEIRFLKGLHALEGTSTYLADCFGECGEGPGYTFDARHNPYARFTHEAPRRIDYIFVRGPDKRARGRAVAARVVLDEVKGEIAASDHWGVYAEIAM